MSNKPVPQPAAIKAAQFISAVLALSLVLFSYERTLVPLYGSGPTAFLLNRVAFLTVIMSALLPFRFELSRLRLSAALIFSFAPNATYWVAVWTARRLKNPVLGPAFTHILVLAPMVFVLATFVTQMEQSARKTDASKKEETQAPIALRLVRAGITYLISVGLAERVWPRIEYLYNISDSQIFLCVAGVSYLWWIALFPNAAIAPSKKKKQIKASSHPIYIKAALISAFIAAWFPMHIKLSSPVLPHPLTETYAHPTEPLQILSAVQSTTGLIIVAQALPVPGKPDNTMHSARYLRAAHSILGGVWTDDKVRILDDVPPLHDSFGTALGDSIYATFVLQEAARLVNSTLTGKTGKWENALIIGLGAGVSATAFMRHEISTTIVEIDPAVYEGARTYFGLPDPGDGRVFLEDARAWAAGKRSRIDSGQKEILFDIVIHDCFSGGGVPSHIFTMEFWQDLKTTMQPDGILAVNFAGILASNSSRLVINTLEKAFGQCRAFHDMFDDLARSMYETEFINMVIFCTQSPHPISFREPRYEDFLGSPLRRHMLKNLAAREVDLALIRPSSKEGDSSRYVLTDAYNPLGKLQDEQGDHHWKVMREVLPDVHWETY